MELEIRSKVLNGSLFEEKLKQLPNIRVKKTGEREIDTYIRQPCSDGNNIIFRIRRKQSGSVFTVKTNSPAEKKDILWHDVDMSLATPDILEEILMSNGWKYAVVIDKVRDSYEYGEFEINYDNILDLGIFVEIEYQAKEGEDTEIKLREMKKTLSFLGCPENDIINKGYVKLMLEKQVS